MAKEAESLTPGSPPPAHANRKTRRVIAAVAALILLVVIAAFLYARQTKGDGAEISSVPQTPVKIKIVDIQGQLVGQTVDDANKLLGYPNNGPTKQVPTTVPQDSNVNQQAPLIVTAACYDGVASQLVLEVANPEQIDSFELGQLKYAVVASRQENIKRQTGCSSPTTGIPVKAE
jgi:hypothetical protein